MTPLLDRLLGPAKPLARAVKYRRLHARSRRLSLKRDVAAPMDFPIAFVHGCGRSGTTILGRVLQSHPGIHYLFEPYHAWAVVDPNTDMLRLYTDGRGATIMRGEEVTEETRERFRRVILSEGVRSGRGLLVEKTPINALRLGYLEILAPHARHVHIVRDGVDVVRSIDRLASANAYAIAGKPTLNRWWGVGGWKWEALARDGAAAGYYPDEVPSLRTHRERGAYEWLVTMHEIDRYRQRLGDRLLELTYEDLTGRSRPTLVRVCEHLALDAPAAWLGQADGALDEARRNPGDPLRLPERTAEDFNRFQERFGFKNRAESSAGPAT